MGKNSSSADFVAWWISCLFIYLATNQMRSQLPSVSVKGTIDILVGIVYLDHQTVGPKMAAIWMTKMT